MQNPTTGAEARAVVGLYAALKRRSSTVLHAFAFQAVPTCCRPLFGAFASGQRTHYTRTFAAASFAIFSCG
jgi:hypothetical protein